MQAALFGGEPGPPELDDYISASWFWTRLGLREDDLESWPEERVRRFRLIMRQVFRYEEWLRETATQRAKAESQKGKGR